MTQCYEGLVDVLVIDYVDEPAEAPIPHVATTTLKDDRASSRRLPETVLEVAA